MASISDAVKEGDGDRILLAWKILIPVFKATNHVNYLKEAVNLVLQTQILSQRKAGQLLWSRCINTQGRKGHNLPCDLHQEHLNRRLKGVLRSVGANVTPEAIILAGKSISTVDKICTGFELQTSHCKNYSVKPTKFTPNWWCECPPPMHSVSFTLSS